VITDAHAHLFHPSWYPRPFLDAVGRSYAARRKAAAGSHPDPAAVQQLYRMLTDAAGDMTIRIMDQAGIDRKVIHVIDWGVELGEPEKSIRDIHREILGICRRFPDRLVGFAGVDPRRKDALPLLEWAIESLGARGLKLHPTGAWSLSDPGTREVVGAVAARHLPVMVHVGKTVDVLSDRNSTPAAFLQLARSFPESVFIAGHSGFDSWEIFAGTTDLPTNVYFDVSGWQERSRGDGSALVAEVEALHRAFPKRVFFGTDSPFYGFNLIPAEKLWVQRIALPFAHKWADLDLSVSSV